MVATCIFCHFLPTFHRVGESVTSFFISLDLDLAWQGGLAKEQGGELPRKIRSISFLPVFDFIRGTHVVLICTWIREGGEERKGKDSRGICLRRLIWMLHLICQKLLVNMR